MQGLTAAALIGAAVVGAWVVVVKLRLFRGRHCKHAPSLVGHVAAVTGTTSGIGRETVLGLARLGATIVLLDRDPKRAAETAALARAANPHCTVEAIACDLSDLVSVNSTARAVLAKYNAIHLLVCNAGVSGPFAETRQGYELCYGTNHLGHFALTTRLLPALLRGKARVVVVSSALHAYTAKVGIDFEHGLRAADVAAAGGFRMFTHYGQSKLANILFAKELQHRYGSHGLTAVSLHPGVVATGMTLRTPLLGSIIGLFSRTPEEGAQNSLHCALAPLEEIVPGGYYVDLQPVEPSAQAKDEQLARRLWEVSEEQVAFAGAPN